MADEKILQALGMRRRSRDKGLPLSSARAIRRAINVGVMRREWGDGAQKASCWEKEAYWLRFGATE